MSVFDNVTNDASVNYDLNASSSDAVRLPFPTMLLWWTHGQKNMKALGSAMYYGGFLADKDVFEEVTSAIPSALGLAEDAFELEGNQGSYKVYGFRALALAPIARRYRWITPRPGDSGKGKSHVQYLCLVGVKGEDGKYTAIAPAIVSAKSLSAMHLQNAFKDFEKATEEQRKVTAKGLGVQYFWHPIGTFGDAAHETLAQGSVVTYPKVALPKEVTPDYIEQRFVGVENMAKIVDLRGQAQEWLDAWSKENLAKANANAEEPKKDDIPF